jgi:hypothetical protein
LDGWKEGDFDYKFPGLFPGCIKEKNIVGRQLGQEQQFLTALGGVLSTDRIFSGIEWRLGALFDGAISLVKV